MQTNHSASLTNVTKPAIQTSFSELVSYFVREVIVTINLVFIGEVICVCGVVGNVVNIIVFVKHGFIDTINVSLTALSLADLGALVSIQWFIICANPWFATADLPFFPFEIQSLTAGFPHIYFTRVTGFITAFISSERCICVVFPMKVKEIFTKKCAITYNVVIFLLMTLSVFPVYYTAYYDWKFDIKSNRSKLGIFYTRNKDQVLEISLLITNFGVPLLSFVMIISSTILTGIVLKQKTKWRKSVSGGFITSGNRNTPGDNVSTKEKKIIVMITTVSVMFIISFLPLTIILAARGVVPELSITGRYANMNWLVVSIALLMETINSSTNTLIFYKMSSKYRETIHEMFSVGKKFV